MQVWLRDERSSEPMSGESLQVAPTLTRPVCRRAAQECSMHTVQRALAVRASVKCSGRRTFAGGMIKSAHGGRADTTVSMRPCSDSCCVREAASRGGYSRALPLTVCAFERRRKRGSRGRSGAKNGRNTCLLADLFLQYDRTKQPDFVGPGFRRFHPGILARKPPTRRLHGTRRRRRAALARGTRHPRQRRAPGVPSL